MHYPDPCASLNREDTMSKDQELLQIGEFARLADSNLRTIRYYEELGLLTPASRSAGGFRYYRHNQLDRMVAIKRLQDLGLSLKQIAESVVGDENSSGADRLARIRAALAAQIALTEDRIQIMKESLEEMQESHSKLTETCESCDQIFSRENCDPCSHGHGKLSSVLRGLL
jgi:DNA-binding transcriptional MerR regulator